MTESQAEQQFGVDISSRRQLNELQRLQQTHGDKVDEWVDEGMPREAMGRPDQMRAFRMRKEGSAVSSNTETTTQRDSETTSETGSAAKIGGHIQRMDQLQKPSLSYQRDMLNELSLQSRGLLSSTHPIDNGEKLRWSRNVLDLWNNQFAPRTVSEMISQLESQPQDRTMMVKSNPEDLLSSVLIRDNENKAQQATPGALARQAAPGALARSLTEVHTDGQNLNRERLGSMNLSQLLSELSTGPQRYHQQVHSSTMAAETTLRQMNSEWGDNMTGRSTRYQAQRRDFDLARQFVAAKPRGIHYLTRNSIAKEQAGQVGKYRAKSALHNWRYLRQIIQSNQNQPASNNSVNALQEQLNNMKLGAGRQIQPRESRFKPRS